MMHYLDFSRYSVQFQTTVCLAIPFVKNHMVLFPSGEFETYVTLQELQACEGMTFYRILEGYQFIPHSDIYPYRDFIQNLYQKRLELKQENNPLQLPIKIILNSIYGKTGQSVNHKIGNLFKTEFFRGQSIQNFIIQLTV